MWDYNIFSKKKQSQLEKQASFHLETDVVLLELWLILLEERLNLT